MYHVKFDHTLSPPDLFETIEQAHEFYLNNRFENDIAYTREEVRPARLGDLITPLDLTSSMRENAQRLFGDDSFVDTHIASLSSTEMMAMIQGALDAWGLKFGVQPEGQMVVGQTRVSVPRQP
jgi:hypothetical protein